MAANRGGSRAERGGWLRGNGVVEALGPLEGAHGHFLRRDERMGIKGMGVLKMVYGENHGLAM